MTPLSTLLALQCCVLLWFQAFFNSASDTVSTGQTYFWNLTGFGRGNVGGTGRVGGKGGRGVGGLLKGRLNVMQVANPRRNDDMICSRKSKVELQVAAAAQSCRYNDPQCESL